uniref:DDE Tnp4 domain-containing protein n=1 Tax=Oryza brachyantha TaxID=4533 RepID=J3MDX7_ORYBR
MTAASTVGSTAALTVGSMLTWTAASMTTPAAALSLEPDMHLRLRRLHPDRGTDYVDDTDNLLGHPDWKKFKADLPVYLPKMDRMFQGVAVNGSTSYVATATEPVDYENSDDDDEFENEDEDLTPRSHGHKWGNKTSTTGSSLRKSLSQENSKVKCAWPGAILGWVTDREVISRVRMSEDKVRRKDMGVGCHVHSNAVEEDVEHDLNDNDTEEADDVFVTTFNAHVAWLSVLWPKIKCKVNVHRSTWFFPFDGRGTTVCQSMTKLASDVIKPRVPHFTEMHPRLRNRRFYPYFKDCIGAIYGTHVPCVVPGNKVEQYMSRKGMTTQNVMAVCDFDMRFTFVLASWPESVQDMRVFEDTMSTYGHLFPHPPAGKYYLVDSRYADRPNILLHIRERSIRERSVSVHHKDPNYVADEADANQVGLEEVVDECATMDQFRN